jgi:hypothetical protein
MAVIDWPAAITALDTGQLPCSAGEQKILRLAASLAEDHPVRLATSVTSLDDRNIQLLVTAIPAQPDEQATQCYWPVTYIHVPHPPEMSVAGNVRGTG